MLIATTAVLEILVTFLGSLVAGFLGAPSASSSARFACRFFCSSWTAPQR